MGTGYAGSVFGENSFYGETQITNVAKRSSDPRVAYPAVTVQVRDVVRVVRIIDPLPHRESVFGENSIYRDPGCKWAPNQQRYDTGEPGKVQGQDRVGIADGSFG